MDFMAEVDAEISKILNTRTKEKLHEKENKYCDENNLQDCLLQLTQEFDYVDVNQIKDVDLSTKIGLKTALIQVVNSSFNLLKLQKETRLKLTESNDTINSIKGEVLNLRKTNESLRKDLKTKDVQLKIQSERQKLERIESNDLKQKVSTVKKEIQQIQKENASTVNHYKFEMKKILNENESQKNPTSKIINDYQKTEKKHASIIANLKTNNQELLEEILCLKDEISVINNK